MASTVKVSGDGVQAALDQLEAAKNKELQVGWFESAAYDDNTPVAQVANQNEFGAGIIPPRPFMRPAIANNSKTWARTIDAMNKNGVHAEDIFTILGGIVQGDIKNAITAVTAPPLAGYTILKRLEKRASEERTAAIMKPLIDTGHMQSTVTFEIKK